MDRLRSALCVRSGDSFNVTSSRVVAPDVPTTSSYGLMAFPNIIDVALFFCCRASCYPW